MITTPSYDPREMREIDRINCQSKNTVNSNSGRLNNKNKGLRS